MKKFVKALGAPLFLAGLTYAAYAQSTPKITADLANKCREQAVKAYPTPKAGTKASGREKAQRDFFQACVSKGAGNN